MDIEFQDYKRVGCKQSHRVGRVAIVNTRGETVLDVYAVYNNEHNVKKKFPPARFGVKRDDLVFDNGAVHASEVEQSVKQILQDRTVIMHDGRHDQTAFYLVPDVFSASKIFDTQSHYSYMQFDGRPGLRTLTSSILGRTIQAGGRHSPVEDAVATMDLWLVDHKWDAKAGKVATREGKTTVEKTSSVDSVVEGFTAVSLEQRCSGQCADGDCSCDAGTAGWASPPYAPVGITHRPTDVGW